MSGRSIQDLKNVYALTFPWLQETEKHRMGKNRKISRIGEKSDSISVKKSIILAVTSCADCSHNARIAPSILSLDAQSLKNESHWV